MRPHGDVRKKGRDKERGGFREHHIWVITENQKWIEIDMGWGEKRGKNIV